MIDHFHSGKPWESPELVSRNRLPMRSPLFPFPDAGAALRDALAGPRGRSKNPGGLPAGTPWVLTLDGDWRFSLASCPEAVPPHWNGEDFDDSAWSSIRIPGSWSLQGHDKPHYTNVVMPFGNTPPSSPATNPTGLHRTTFELPAGWKGRRVVLRVGSAESFLSVWANGTEVGFSKDSRLPAEFDLTPFLHEGRNALALMVIRYSDSSFIEDQDQWWLGGLHRSITLYSTEAAWIGDLDARPVLSEDFRSGSVELVASIGFSSDPARDSLPEGSAATDYDQAAASSGAALSGDGKAYLVRVRLFAPGSDPKAPGAGTELEVGTFYRSSRWEARFSMPVAAPALWSEESPNLYVLVVTLMDPCGREIESEACRIGFRNVRVRDSALLVNGKRIIFKGVNRHEHDEKTGKTLTTESMVRDIELLKRHNFNAVRTSHYPDDERWYELCDEFGLYVFDEADIESHAYYNHLCRDPRWLLAFTDRVSRMAIRDKNHASVIVWSLGNESGYGPNHDAAAGWLRSFDPSRPLHYEGACRPDSGQGPHPLDSAGRGKAATDIVSTMYPTVAFLAEWDRSNTDDRPFIMCEFSHAMGNSNGSLSDYWELVESGRALQGGFIWEWMDHGLLVGPGGADTPTSVSPAGANASAADSSAAGKAWRYGGDFGETPADLDFIADGLVFPDRTLKPVMAECAFLFRPVRVYAALPAIRHVRAARHAGSPPASAGARFGRVFIENRYDFNDLSGLELEWSVVSGDGVVARGSAALPAIPAGGIEPVDLGLPVSGAAGNDLRRALREGECVLLLDFALAADRAWATKGHVVAREQLPLSGPAARPCRKSPSPAVGTGFSAEGFLSSLRSSSGTELLAEPLMPCLFRAPTQNDGLKNFMGFRGKPDFSFYYTDKPMYGWLDAGLDDLRHELESREEDGGVLRMVHRIGTAKGVSVGSFLQTWTRDEGTGGIRGDFVFDLNPELPELPRVGLRCRLDPAFDSARWFGLGPHEAYSDRKASGRLGVWSESLAGLSVPYIVPQENGNRHGTRWVELSAASGGRDRLKIRGENPFDFSLTPYSEAELWEAKHWDRLMPFAEAAERGAFLHLDAAQRGLGTATCGPDVLERYRLRPGVYRLSLYLDS
ncbi:MAG TPA: glycoside hydrolase family 2 [Treponema sp.]|nr:MAG: hypothetical protein A2Y36_10455 [Treponema sp. GWA1_62_8]OHE68615.1 MAG: hypothetical protein A2001_05785 [Treponema sp. GWC1_61_84]OHE70400.1 MAG: hypothetical protein A2413_15365 [Treponema sp. RIFOXYC1_FULL_61_9]HCM26565.1 glycoside hydrolase family 2 [Treponema sp.]